MWKSGDDLFSSEAFESFSLKTLEGTREILQRPHPAPLDRPDLPLFSKQQNIVGMLMGS